MLNTALEPTRVYTPDQVAQMLQLSKNTVYELISRGEIVAKKIGKVYRIPAASIAFIFTGLDYDLYQMDQEDQKYLPRIEKALKEVRSELK
jgi:excisionase family DNA binding protein